MNALVLFSLLIQQIQAYENMIDVVLQHFSFVPAVAFDVCVFCMVNGLCSTNNKSQQDGLSVIQWCSSLCNLIGGLDCWQRFGEDDSAVATEGRQQSVVSAVSCVR